MKKLYFLSIAVLTFVFSSSVKSQTIDTLGNFFTYYDYMMDYFQNKANQQDVMYYEVDGWKEFIRWKLASENRHDEYGNFTPYAEAMDDYYNNYTDYTPATLPSWEYIGHDGIYADQDEIYNCTVGQGNINRIWVNPNNIDSIVAGGNEGSLWRTIDGGKNWECISDTEPLMDGHASIEVDSIDQNKIYVAQAGISYSNGLFYTDDGGLTWTNNKVYYNNYGHNLFPSGNKREIPRKWIVNPDNDSIMYLLTWHMVIRSMDGGQTWDSVLVKTDSEYPIWTNEQGFHDIQFDPIDPSIFYVTGKEAFRFTNNGNNIEDITESVLQWSVNNSAYYKIIIGTQVNFPNKIWFAVHSYGGNDALLYYDKALDTFVLLKSQANLVDALKGQCEISPLDDEHILLGGVGTYLYNHGIYSNIAICDIPYDWTHDDVRDAKYLVDENDNEVIIVGNDGSVFRTDYDRIHGDWDWNYIGNDSTENGIRNGHLHGFDCSDSPNDILFAGFQDMGSALKLEDQWYHIYLAGDGGPGVIDKTDPNYMYLSGWNSPAHFFRTTDGGKTLTSFFQNYDHAKPPVVLNPSNPNELFIGDFEYLYKFSNARQSTSYDILKYIPDTTSGYEHTFVNEIAISESNEDVIFFSTGVYWPYEPAYWHSSFFKSINGGDTWTDITAYLTNALKYGPITGIAITPWDENEIWTCFGNTSYSNVDSLAKKVYHSTNGGTTWTAMAEGLYPRIPANEIVFDKKSNLLYLATDVGVYYYDTAEEAWYNMVSNLPTTYNLHIRFNHALNKLRVGTYGRGIWQTDIPCNTNYVNQVISSNITWSTPQHIYSNVEIDSAVTLTITSEVFMAGGKQIIVKKGGHLLISGGTITNGCGGLWYGVMVLGDPSAPQTQLNQGYVEITNGGTIENSKMGVFAYKMVMDETDGWLFVKGHEGGIIQAAGGNFINNITAVQFKDYATNSTSYFNSCTFETNNAYLGLENPSYFMKVWEMDNIDIINCDFVNKNDSLYMQSGIYCYNSDINVEGLCTGQDCTWDYGLFENLEYGIYAINSSSNQFIDIRHTDFNNNFRGVYISGMSSARVTENNFIINEDFVINGGCGLYLHYSTGYWVEANNFEHAGNSTRGIGIVVHNSGTAANEIYRNSFVNLEQGISAQELNRSSIYRNQGLQILCNDFDLCDADILVPMPMTAGKGINPYQGVNGTHPEDMAGNLFYINDATPDGDYDDLNNEGSYFRYVYPSNPALGYEDSDPVDFTTTTVGEVPKYVINNPQYWYYDDGCPSQISSGGGGHKSTGLGYKELLAYYTGQVEDLETTLTELIDGGDTEGLNTEVELSTPPETMVVYNELMSEAPFVSETVVETAIDKEEVLPNALVRDVMVANPQSATSEELIEKLDNRDTPMPGYMKAQVLQARNTISMKGELESKLSGLKLRQARALNGVVREYLTDTINNETASDSLVSLYESFDDKNIKYRLAMLHLLRGEYQQGNSVLNDIPIGYDLSAEELVVHNTMIDYYNIVMGLKQDGRTELEATETEIAQLFDIEEAEAGIASIYARNVLIALDEIDYLAPIQVPDFSKSTKEMEAYMEILNAEPPSYLEVFPNPSKGFVIVHYKQEIEKEGLVEIRDVNGIAVKSIAVNSLEDQLTVNTQGWKPGMYIATLIIDGSSMESFKFTLVK